MHEPHEQDRKHGTFLIFFFLEVSGMWLLSFLFLGWVFLPLSTTSPDNTEAFVRAIRHSEIQAAIYRFVKIDEKRWTKNANNNDTEAFVKAIRHFEIQTTIYKFDKIDEIQDGTCNRSKILSICNDTFFLKSRYDKWNSD